MKSLALSLLLVVGVVVFANLLPQVPPINVPPICQPPVGNPGGPPRC